LAKKIIENIFRIQFKKLTYPDPIGHQFEIPEIIKENLVIVSHPSALFDDYCSAARGIKAVLETASLKSKTVVFLLPEDKTNDLSIYTHPKDKHFSMSSTAGEPVITIFLFVMTLNPQ